MEEEYGQRPTHRDDVLNGTADGLIYHPVLEGERYLEVSLAVAERRGGHDSAQEFLKILQAGRGSRFTEEQCARFPRWARYRHAHFSPRSSTVDELIGRRWWFGRSNGEEIAPSVTFWSDGRIEGYTHPNERAWAVREGRIVLLNDERAPTTEFDRGYLGDDGKLVLLGRYLDSNQYVHILDEGDPI